MKGKPIRMAMVVTVNANIVPYGRPSAPAPLRRGDELYIPRELDDDFDPQRPPVPAELAVRIKHLVISHQRRFEKMRREVEAFENMEKLGSPNAREPIPDSVRLFVWQRDQGQCVKCGQRDKLEFDHIIPVSLGGSSTERNVQLLCENCNRAKGAAI
jgi:hypothetical protein